MKIIVEDSTWNNVGDGWYQTALFKLLKDLYPNHEIYIGEGPIKRAFRINNNLQLKNSLELIIGVSESSIRAVPQSYYEGSLGLGATHERSVFFAVLPAAKQGILAGVILGVGRAIGETMAVIMVAGNQPVVPGSIFSGVRTMTANIVMEMGYAADLHREALLGTAVVLFVFILIINLCFSMLKRRAD